MSYLKYVGSAHSRLRTEASERGKMRDLFGNYESCINNKQWLMVLVILKTLVKIVIA